ncbi:unnamed protein product, partial [Allacma fusca]
MKLQAFTFILEILLFQQVKCLPLYNQVLNSIIGSLFSRTDIFLIYDNAHHYRYSGIKTGTSGSKSLQESNLHSVLSSRDINGLFILDLSVSTFEFQSENLVHKQSSKCAAVIIHLQNSLDITKVSHQLTKLLTPTYGAATYKDEDYYILLTTPENVKLLLEQEFIKELKFKIILYHDPNHASLKAVTTCFYCSHGNPEILSLDREISEIVSKTVNGNNHEISRNFLYPDFTRNAFGHELQ